MWLLLIYILLKKQLLQELANQDIIEKIDIGGISLIRAAAKNYADVICVSLLMIMLNF